MGISLYWINGPRPGRLAIAPRPRGGDWLEDEVRSWRDSGVDEVVSLLTPDEVAELALDQEGKWCRAHGIQFHSFSIPDRGIPTSRDGLNDLVQGLERILNAGKTVALHCRQGIGRSALVAAVLLVSSGKAPEMAWEAICQARGCPVPDTIEQRDWMKGFAQAHQA